MFSVIARYHRDTRGESLRYSREYLHTFARCRSPCLLSTASLRTLTMSSGCSDLLSSNGSVSSQSSAPTRSTLPSHPYLSPDQASTIASWTSSIPSRSPELRTLTDDEVARRKAAFEAYRQMKLAMFFKSTGRP